MLLIEPPRSPGDLNFALFGVPVRITPYFWIFALLFGLGGSQSPWALLGFVAAMLLSLLIHEMGHALAFRNFGYYPYVTLTMMGGLTSTGPGMVHGARKPGFTGRVMIVAAGPGAELIVAAALMLALNLIGYNVKLYWQPPFDLWVGVLGPRAVFSPQFTVYFLNPFLFFSVFWAVLNLLPVFPLDGGQIAREILVQRDSWNGIRWSLMLSFTVAAVVAFVALVHDQNWFMAMLFGFLAYTSYQQLTFGSGRW